MKISKESEQRLMHAVAIGDEELVSSLLVEHAEFLAKLIGLPSATIVSIVRSPAGRASIMESLLASRQTWLS